jgi:hypothetical protein
LARAPAVPEIELKMPDLPRWLEPAKCNANAKLSKTQRP